MLTLSPHAYAQLKALVKDYSGIDLDTIHEKGVQDRILKHLKSRGFSSFDDYFALLSSSVGEPERDELASLVTVNETFFFRHPAQFRHLAEQALPELWHRRQKAGVQRINLWSAGCSTGEEPCSIAHMVATFCGLQPQAQVFILASDINSSSLESARAGLYRKRAMRAPSFELQATYPQPFVRETPEGWQVEPAILARIKWQRINLRRLPTQNGLGGGFDVIFCRNVMIYFDEPFRLELLATFHRLLHEGGFLYLGESEALPLAQTFFQPMKVGNTYVHVKK